MLIEKYYNTIADQRNARQYNAIGSVVNGLTKTFCRTYHMNLDGNVGGIRVKRKTIKSCNGIDITINYSYGKGHYQCMPLSYLANYISGFSDFMTEERIRHQREQGNYSSLYVGGPIYSLEQNTGIPFIIYNPPFGFSFLDFDYFMSSMIPSIRFDNNVSDSHYYEYIKEIRNDGSETKYYYKSPLATDETDIKYKRQSLSLLKGYTNDYDNKKVIAIMEDADLNVEPLLWKKEELKNGTSSPVKITKWEYQFDSKIDKILNSISLLDLITPMIYYSYAYSSTQKLEWANSGYHFSTYGRFSKPDPNCSGCPLGNNARSLAQVEADLNSLSTQALRQAYVAAHGIPIESNTSTIRQTIWKKLSSEQVTLDGVTKTKNYFYDNPTHKQITRIEESTSDSRIVLKTKFSYVSDPQFSSSTYNDNTSIAIRDLSNVYHAINYPVETMNLESKSGVDYVVKSSLKKYNTYGFVNSVPLINLSSESELKVLSPIAKIANFTESHIDGSGNFVNDAAYETKLNYDLYDVHNNVLQYHKQDGIPISNKWSANAYLPIAIFQNAQTSNVNNGDECGYIGFESGTTNSGQLPDNDYWNISTPSSVVSNGAHTGQHSQRVNPASTGLTYSAGRIFYPNNQGQKYVLSAWIKTDVGFGSGGHHGYLVVAVDNVNSQVAYLTTPISHSSNWQYIEREIDLPSLGASNSNRLHFSCYADNEDPGHGFLIDDIKLQPFNALSQTYTYDPVFNFKSSESDANWNSIFFEYDGLGRIKYIRDLNKSILEENTYNQMLPCN